MKTRIFVSDKIKKVYRGLKLNALPEKADMEAHQNSWNAHYLTIERKKCWIVTHNLTRYSVVLPDMTAQKTKDLRWWFMDQIINQFLKDDTIRFQEEVDPAKFEDFFGEFEYYPTNNDKSTIGTVNQRIKELEYHAYPYGYDGIAFYKVGAFMNQLGKVKRSGKRVYIEPSKEMLNHISDNAGNRSLE